MMRAIECYFNTGRQPFSVRRGQQQYRSFVEKIYRDKGLQERRNDIKKCCEHLFEYNKGRCRKSHVLGQIQLTLTLHLKSWKNFPVQNPVSFTSRIGLVFRAN